MTSSAEASNGSTVTQGQMGMAGNSQQDMMGNSQ